MTLFSKYYEQRKLLFDNYHTTWNMPKFYKLSGHFTLLSFDSFNCIDFKVRNNNITYQNLF